MTTATAIYARLKELIPEADGYSVNVSAATYNVPDLPILEVFTLRAIKGEFAKNRSIDVAYGYGYTESEALTAIMADYKRRQGILEETVETHESTISELREEIASLEGDN